MPKQPLFESLEGLRGTGKSTVAPLLAAARGAVLVPTVPAGFQALRRQVDLEESVEARMCFYLSALFAAVEDIRRHLTVGTPVVVESYFARCLANHRGFGSRLGIRLPPDLPRPVTYRLLCSEDERQRRLAGRTKPASLWDTLSEKRADRIESEYAHFPMHRIDTTHLSPDQVVHAILTLDQEGIPDADEKPVGTHPYLLPAVPHRPERAHPQ